MRALVSLAVLATAAVAQDGILVEAESFDQHGGWALDTQFVDAMGSPYLLAHGLGQPVADAVTSLRIERAGRYRVLARTLDWVARCRSSSAPKARTGAGTRPARSTSRPDRSSCGCGI